MTQNFTPINAVVVKPKSPHFALLSGDTRGRAKEAEPASLASEKYEIKEVVEHRPEEEARPFVTPRPENVELPPDLKKFGLKASGTTQFPSYQNIKLPLSDDKVVIGLHAPISSSLRWLATLALYLLRQAHLTLKVIHGRVIRVIKG